MQDIALIVQSCSVAAVYSLMFYAKNRQKHGKPFDWMKAASTVLVGVFVGFGFAQAGVVPTMEALEARLAGMGVTIVMIDQLLKMAVEALPAPSDG